MKKAVTLKKNHEFRRLYTKGASAAASGLVIYCRKNRLGRSRLGVTVSTKLGCAVVRNRLRRRLRECYRLNEAQFRPGLHMVVVARGRAVHATYRELEQSLLGVARKLGLLLEDAPHA